MLSVYSPAFTSPFSRPFSGFGSFDREDLDDFFGPLLLQPQVDRARHKRPRKREVEPRGPGGVLSLFDDFMKHGDHGDVSNMRLDLDVVEQEGNYQVKADLPGVKKEDIKVSLNEETNVLTLSATKSDEVNHDTNAYKRRERHFGSVSRSIRLPENSNLEKIECAYQDGVLSLQVPKVVPIEDAKRDEEEHVKSIEVK